MKMVDVGSKAQTERVAVARGRVRMSSQALAAVRDRTVEKGDVLAAAVRGGLLSLEPAEIRPPATPLATAISAATAAEAAVDAIAAMDAAGDLVGILRRHETGTHRLRPNFRGAPTTPGSSSAPTG